MLTFPALFGCRGGWSAESAKPQSFISPSVEPIELSATQPIDQEAASEDSPDGKSQEVALAEIINELTEIGALDDESKRLLQADLREAKPENWPMIVKQFRSALAYRKQLAAREQRAQAKSADMAEVDDRFAMHGALEPTSSSAAKSSPQVSPASYNAKQVQATPPAHKMSSAIAEVSPVTAESPEVSRHHSVAPPAESRTLATPVVLSQPPSLPLPQANSFSSNRTSQDWRAQLQRAVVGMQASVQPVPGTTDEVNEHMRLRLLQLLAGDQEASLQPIPGATASQQDYWNQQLFSVSTFLDNKSQPDDKRRAAGSLTHLDQARAKLAELATLQVRSLAFVDSVDGYGAYQLHENSKFRPGQEVTLYAEIENFTSESTKDGYLTRLGTSFEILDNNGKRVDSAQFPEVEDLCKTPRRDFHMQYTVTLPTRIYPDGYQIRLIVSDQQSHKIGQAGLPFEISE